MGSPGIAGAAVMEGEMVADIDSVDVAAVERSCGSNVLLSGSFLGAVEFILEHELFMQAPASCVDSYGVGGWTSAYNAN